MKLVVADKNLCASCGRVKEVHLTKNACSQITTIKQALQTKNTVNLLVHSQNVRVYREVFRMSEYMVWVTGFFYIL